MDVQFLHTGEPVLVVEEGEGEPGGYVVGPNRTQVWTDNPDYRPAKVVRLGVLEEVEQGSLAGSYEDTATAQRAAAIESGDHPETEGIQFVPETTGANGSPATSGPVGTGGQPSQVSPARPTDEVGAVGADTPPDALGPLSDSERDELNRLRAADADRQAATDPARDTSASTGLGNSQRDSVT